jgi:hypothetical protein
MKVRVLKDSMVLVSAGSVVDISAEQARLLGPRVTKEIAPKSVEKVQEPINEAEEPIEKEEPIKRKKK